MRAIRFLFLLALALHLAGCDTGAIAGPAELHGTWVFTPTAGMMDSEHRLHFGPGGGFRASREFYTDAGELVEYTRVTGRYRVEGDRLFVLRVREERWAKHGAEPRRTGERAFPPEWAEVATVRVEGDRLTYSFVSAPLDIPETFTWIYHRER
jgi:hypothetical protein